MVLIYLRISWKKFLLINDKPHHNSIISSVKKKQIFELVFLFSCSNSEQFIERHISQSYSSNTKNIISKTHFSLPVVISFLRKHLRQMHYVWKAIKNKDLISVPKVRNARSFKNALVNQIRYILSSNTSSL